MKSRSNGAWILLWLVPSLLAVVVLIPSLGQRSQGILPELVAGPLARLSIFRQLAADLRQWAIAGCAVAILMGVVHFFLIRSGWRGRLATYNPAIVTRYRAFVLGRAISAAIAGGAVVLLPLLLAGSLSAIAVPGWILLGVWVAFLSTAQCLTGIFGTLETRRLYKGN